VSMDGELGTQSFGARSELVVGDRRLAIWRLDALEGVGDVGRLPFSLKVLLENLLRHEDGRLVTAADVERLAGWASERGGGHEVPFLPERVLMQDFTGVPAVCDLAAMRDAIGRLSGSPEAVNPLIPVELVIDHSVIAESARRPDAFRRNAELEAERNAERYQLLRWAQGTFDGFLVVPPDTGICHQVNLEYLARVVFERDGRAFFDTLVGTDSHTPMVNGLGVLGWGVGGIEAEAAMLGQPISLVTPEVVGLRLEGELAEGVTATDLVLTIAELLRSVGVVGKIVECFGPGLAAVPVETRATIGNMSPEYGATATIFPIDEATLSYLRFTGRSSEHVALVEAYAKEQGVFGAQRSDVVFSAEVTLDLSSVEPSIAGPARPQDRIPLRSAKGRVAEVLAQGGREGARGADARSRPVPATLADGTTVELDDGAVVIAAITSCTNTSNPAVMVAAGLLAERAVEAGLQAKPWVKTSLAPGSRVVMDYLARAGLLAPLEKLGFYLVGYGCTTCIGNSGPLLEGVSEAVAAGSLQVAAVLSGNRNFEGRIHPDVRMNFLASPPLVVAYALAGTVAIDLTTEALGTSADGRPVKLADLWPSVAEVADAIRRAVGEEQFRDAYRSVLEGDEHWKALEVPSGSTFAWSPQSTYVQRPPFFDQMTVDPSPLGDLRGARVLALLGDSVTTDHISPAGAIRPDSPAGRWLREHGVAPADFNSYGARRGNHEVMIRGTFANVRLRNRLAPGTEGGWTTVQPDGDVVTIFEAAERYRARGVPLLVVAGKEYGSGSSRDWAAKGTALLGVRAVLAESFERIHRSNLVGMGVLPLELPAPASEIGIDGTEPIDVLGIEALNHGEVPAELEVRVGDRSFSARLRIDTPAEADYVRHGGILPFVLRQLGGRGR